MTTSAYRNPADLPATDVCPRCKAVLERHHFGSGSTRITTWHCKEHGEIIPMRSHISNPPPPYKYRQKPETDAAPTQPEKCDEAAVYDC